MKLISSRPQRTEPLLHALQHDQRLARIGGSGSRSERARLCRQRAFAVHRHSDSLRGAANGMQWLPLDRRSFVLR